MTVKPAPTKFIRELQDKTINAGDQTKLIVEIDQPVKGAKWYKNGVEIAAVANLKPETVSDTKFQLSLKDAEKGDSGDYKVVETWHRYEQFTNLQVILDTDAGPLESSCKLTVRSPPVNKPKLLNGLQDQTVCGLEE